MRYKFKAFFLILFVFTGLLTLNLYAEKYAGEITRAGVGIRNSALGGTGLTDVKSPARAYWKAALLAELERNSLTYELSHSEEFMGLVNYDSFSATWGKESKYSLSVMRIGVEKVPLTKLPNPDEEPGIDNQPYKYKSITNSDYIAYFGLYRRINSYVVGFTPKLIYRSLAETNGYGIGADVSTYLKPTENTLIGLKVRDFFSTQLFWQNGTNETVRPSVDTEVSYLFTTPLICTKSRLILSCDVYAEDRELASTNRLGLFSLDYHIGLEVPMLEYLTFYIGYDVRNLTSGLTLDINQFQVNYCFKYDTELDNSHKVSLGLKL
jgi:hypothetical protein